MELLLQEHRTGLYRIVRLEAVEVKAARQRLRSPGCCMWTRRPYFVHEGGNRSAEHIIDNERHVGGLG